MATISINDNDARIQYTQAVVANTTQLTIDFPFFELDDIKVIKTDAGTDTTLSRGSGANDFVVVGTAVDDGFSGGYITFNSSNTDATIRYTIYRDTPIARTSDFPTSGPFNISSLNTDLDKIYAVMQQVENANDRALTLPDSDEEASITLPTKDDRKGKYLAFNATTGAAEAGGSVADTGTVAAQSTNISTLAGISSNITTVAGISSNVTTVAGISTDVTTVAGKASLITTDFVADLNTLATSAIVNDLDALANLSTEIDALGDITSAISTVNTNISSVNTVSTNISDVNTVATNISTISTKANAGANSDITSLSGLTTALSVAQGGTGSTSASAARTALGLAIGSDVQAYDADTAKLDVTQTFTKAQVPSTYDDTFANLSSAGVFDFDTYQNFIVTLGNNANTLNAPTTEASNVGQTGVFIFIQPSSGDAGTVSLHGDYETVGASGSLTLSSTNSAYDVVPYMIKADNSILLGTPQLAFG